MSNNKRQSGFTVVAALLVVLVLAVLAFAGWYVWQKNKKSESRKSNNTNSQTSNSTNQSNPPKQTDPTEGGKYLVINEWGVRVLLPEGLRGDVLTNVSNVESSGTVLFSSKKLNGLASDDSCNFVKQPDGSYSGGIQASLSRLNPKTYPAETLDYFKSQLTYLKSIGDYEYYSRKPSKNPPVTCLAGQHEVLSRESPIS